MPPGVVLSRLASRVGHDEVHKACMDIHGFPPDLVTTKNEVEKIIKRIEK